MSGATATVVDLSKGLAPRAFDRTGTGANDPLVKATLARLQLAAGRRDAHGILELALKEELAGGQQWSRPSVLNRLCCCILSPISIRQRRSCSSTPENCSARRCAIAIACRTFSASVTFGH